MKCAIIQPHYFPWSGYFNLIFKSDKFVFLDDAQFSKDSWHCKNFIVINKEKYSIKVPTLKAPLSTTIKDKLINQKIDWRSKQAKTILQSYSKHDFINDLSDLIIFFLKVNTDSLSELNINIIKFISKKINIGNGFIYSSDFSFKEKRTNKIVKILNKLNANEYISTVGAKKYLKEDNFKKLSDIKLVFNDFVAPKYNQKQLKKFVGNLSIIDVIANLGWNNTEEYIKSN